MTYEVTEGGEVRPAPTPPSSEQLDRMLTDAQEDAFIFSGGYKTGVGDGREEMRDDLKPYVRHIGTCGAAGGDPEDARCLCGLRQIWMAP